MARIVARPNPFKEEDTYVCDAPTGTCLGRLLQDVHASVIVTLNGDRLERDDWDKTFLQENDLLVIGCEPKDLGIGEIIAIISAVLSVASMVYNLLATPPKPPNPTGLSSDRYANLIGSGNQANKFQVIPKLYGDVQITPPLAANYYTQILEGKQHLVILLCLGYGPLAIRLDPVTVPPLISPTPQVLFLGKKYDAKPGEAPYYPLLKQALLPDGSYQITHGSTRYVSNSNNDLFFGIPALPKDTLLGEFPANTLFFGNTDIKYFQGVEFEIGHPSQITLYSGDNEVDYVNHTFQGPKMTTGKSDLRNHKTLTKPVPDKINPKYFWYTVDNSLESGEDPKAAVIGTVPETNHAVIELDFTALYCSDNKGGIYTAGVRFLVEYRESTATTWKTYAGRHVNDGIWEVKAATNKQYFASLDVAFDPPGQYSIRLTRTQTYLERGTLWYTDCVWQELRSVRTVDPWVSDAPGTHGDHVVLLAMKLEHSGQLNGNVDAVSIRTQSVLPVWDAATDTWEWQPTSNPAWAYVDTLAGNACQTPLDKDSEIDKQAIHEWAQWCDNSQYLTGGSTGMVTQYNKYHTEDEPLLERLRAIATTGYASWTYLDQKFSVAAEFASPSAFYPRQMLTPRNSWGFSFSRDFPLQPHAYRVKYVDPTAWEEAEVVVYGWDEQSGLQYAANTAERYEVINTSGITSELQARRYGNYLFNVLRHRKASYTLETDLETLGLTRGDCLMLAYDTLTEGQAYGRVVEVVRVLSGGETSITHLALDEDITLPPKTSMGLFIRRSDIPDISKLNTLGNSFRLYNDSDAPVAYKAGSRVPLSPAIVLSTRAQDILNGDLFVFGAYQEETILAKIARMTPKADQTVTLGLIPASTQADLMPVDHPDVPEVSTSVTKSLTVTKSLKKASPWKPQQVTVHLVSDRVTVTPAGTISGPVKVSWKMPVGSYRHNTASLSSTASQQVYERSEEFTAYHGGSTRNIVPVSHFMVKWWLSSDARPSLQTDRDKLAFGIPEWVKVPSNQGLSTLLDNVPATRQVSPDGEDASYPYLKVCVAALSPTGSLSEYSPIAVKSLAPDPALSGKKIINENSYDTWLDTVGISRLLTENIQNQNLILTQEVDTNVETVPLNAHSPGYASSSPTALTRPLSSSEIGSAEGAWIITAYVQVFNSAAVAGVGGKTARYRIDLYQDGEPQPRVTTYLNDIKRRLNGTATLRTSIPLVADDPKKSFHVKVARTTDTRLTATAKDSFKVSYSVVISRATASASADDLDPSSTL